MRAIKARYPGGRRKSTLSRQISRAEREGYTLTSRATPLQGTCTEIDGENHADICDKSCNGGVRSGSPCDELDGIQDNLANSMPKQVMEKLMDFNLFRNAPHAFFVEIARRLKLMTYHVQDHIVKAGEPAKAMYWILRGCVNVTSPDGETVHAQLLEGSYFGEIGILFNRSRTATIVAKTKVLLGVLTADNFNQILPAFPQVERLIRDEAQERLAMQDKKKRCGVPSLITSNLSWNSNVEKSVRLPRSEVEGFGPGPLPSPQLNSTEVVDDSISIRQYLKGLPLFTTLPAEIAHRLALCVEIKQAGPYEYIFHSGDRGTNIYFIVSGEMEVLTRELAPTINDGIAPRRSILQTEKLLARLGPGQYFGEMGFLGSISDDQEKSIRSADVRSVSSSTLLVLTGETLKKFCENYPVVKREITKTATDRAYSNLNSVQKKRSERSNSPLETGSTDHKRQKKMRAYGEISEAPPGIIPGAAEALDSIPGSVFNIKFGFNEKRSRPLPSIGPSTQNNSECSKISRTSSPKSLSSITGATSLLELETPQMNSMARSGESFKVQQPLPLAYMPHRRRTRLLSLGGGIHRKRNSVLSIGPLPDRLLLRCFQFLDLPELMKLRLVCRRWRQLLYVAPGLFDCIDLTPWSKSIDDKSLVEITNFVGSRPKTINLSNCFHVTDEGFSYMINEIGIEGELRVIKMRGCWEISAMAIMDISTPYIGNLVEEIDLTACRKVKDDVIQRLLGTQENSIPSMNLMSGGGAYQGSWTFALDEPIRGMEIFNENDKQTTNVGCPNLKVLTLRHCKSLTDSTLRHIALYAHHNLTELDLTRCTGLTDVGFSYWGYQKFASLKKLVLSECIFLTDDSIRSIAHSASVLRELYLSFCCSLTDTALEILCLQCPDLEVLDLSFCGRAVSDVSLLGISMHLRKLRRIILKGCLRVTRSGLDSLLGGYTSLNYIDISQCKNAHMYQGGIEATKFETIGSRRSVFLTMEDSKDTYVQVVF
ncbi:LADA_0H14928g1_1 [Lachancea dasiensis]|uniref:LADA_0H14928g1_1 n=1 Tax=Lachancea dasiensis TaxID=1072105 RepID=A0A1G4K4M2_9SACH|nr:LADA_0H14928g1_1 [Lachancea dasiensis]